MLYFFFFNDTATTEIYTLSLHDALPICMKDIGLHRINTCSTIKHASGQGGACAPPFPVPKSEHRQTDRKSTRLNSSHANISYAVFCLKKKKKLLSYVNHNPA